MPRSCRSAAFTGHRCLLPGARSDRAGRAAAIRYLAVAQPHSAGWYFEAPDDRLRAPIASYDYKDAAGASAFRLQAFDPVTGRPDRIRDTLGGEFFYRFHFELELHYPWGRIIASVAGMWLLVVLISGIVTHRRIFADFFMLRLAKGQRSWLDAHNALCGLALCATIATGLVLWSVSRARRGRHFGATLVARLTVGATGGMLPAIAAFFLANRILPVAMAARADAEVHAFFITWAAMLLFGLARTARRGWIEMMAVAALAWLAVPVVSAITVGLPADGVGIGFDAIAILLGVLAGLTAWALRRRDRRSA